jgi:hypothetical protein
VGKVGSSSVRYSLIKLHLGRRIHHIHYLDLDRLAELEAALKPGFPDSLFTLQHIWRSQHVAHELACNPDDRLQAITLVRDPIARNISSFFQHIQVEPQHDGNDWRVFSPLYGFEMAVKSDESGAPAPGERHVNTLIDVFLSREEHDLPMRWMESELKAQLGIDVYAGEFRTSKGYAIYQSERAELLLFRLRDLNRCATEAFYEFMGLEQFSLINANIAEQKDYTSVYRAFKNAITFSESYLDRMYNSDFCKHFYSDQELEQLRAQWTRADGASA